MAIPIREGVQVQAERCRDTDACGSFFDERGQSKATKASAAVPDTMHKRGFVMLNRSDLLIIGLYVVWETFNVLCISWAKHPVTKQAAYSSPSLVLAAETAKFAISAAELRRAGIGAADIVWEQNWKFAIPALLYSINNNLFVHILRIVPGSVFQMLCNLRSLYTGVLFYFLMDRRLSGQQWLALWLLVVGAALCQYANIDDTSHLRVSQWGVFLSVVYGFISVAAGVWSELLLKKGTKSIHLPLQLRGRANKSKHRPGRRMAQRKRSTRLEPMVDLAHMLQHGCHRHRVLNGTQILRQCNQDFRHHGFESREFESRSYLEAICICLCQYTELNQCTKLKQYPK